MQNKSPLFWLMTAATSIVLSALWSAWAAQPAFSALSLGLSAAANLTLIFYGCWAACRIRVSCRP